ncbi:glycosyltransferase 87 family protein [Acrocarpospora sp. B8E8]|uniref:glycosyltransferase family 87 protein n=1 Tax=Acrocarpospora sp. B8E8 TaxID=3153572 RepID=UPI00325FD9C7
MTRTSSAPGPLASVAFRAVPYVPLGAFAVLGAFLAYFWKSACRFGGAWNTGVEQYSNFCYTDIYPLWFARQLSDGRIPYIDNPDVEYPVGIGAIMEFARRLSFGDGVTFYDITVILMGASLVVGVLLMAALAGPTRRWDALWYAIGPGVVLCAYINWDLAAGALALGGLLAWAREKQYLAGILLALAVATKFYPLMFLGALFLLTVRTGKWLAFGKTLGAAVATWLLVNVPIMLISFAGWSKFYVFSSERGVDWGGLWFFFQKYQWGFLANADTLNEMAMGTLALLLLGIAVLTVSAPRRPRLAQICFLALAAFMVTNKVWSPQYVLWLVPLAVLARPKWPALAIWQVTEVWYFFAIWLYFVGMDPAHTAEGISDGPYFLAVWARALAVIALMALVVWDILRPERDLVRQNDIDDQSGGVFDHAPDRFVLFRRPPAPVN